LKLTDNFQKDFAKHRATHPVVAMMFNLWTFL
jgi:hypothetical protein